MKLFRTIARSLTLILLLIATFDLFSQAGGVTKLYFWGNDWGLMLKNTFAVKGYVLANTALIGAYIIKLVEIWGKKDE